MHKFQILQSTIQSSEKLLLLEAAHLIFLHHFLGEAISRFKSKKIDIKFSNNSYDTIAFL